MLEKVFLSQNGSLNPGCNDTPPRDGGTHPLSTIKNFIYTAVKQGSQKNLFTKLIVIHWKAELMNFKAAQKVERVIHAVL